MTTYGREHDLVNDFLGYLAHESPWGTLLTGIEFNYQRGKTDIVAIDAAGRVIAFEAKLSRWRDALQQAYRNTCFAHRSYVLLPKETAIRASRDIGSFARRRVGICYIDDGLVVLQDASEVRPLQPWLSDQAVTHVMLAQEVANGNQSA